MKLLKSSWRLIVIGILAVILAACQNSASGNSEGETNGNADSDTKTAEEEGNTELEGSVVIDGSGTVYPLMARIAEEYMITKQEDVSVEVSRSGTSAGFEKFLVENGTDFNDASRQIKDEEAEKAEELGIEVKELKVALDGLTFVVNKDNDWASEMTAEDLKNIFLADGEVTNWSDINPDWPNEKINTYGPNENHGTYEFFFENVLEENDLVEDINLQQEYSTLVNLIEDDKNGIAFFGFGYYVTNQDKLQAVSVDFGNGSVEPSLDTIAEDGDYAPFTRPVFTYLNVNHAKEKPQVLDFTEYVLESINEFAGETGFAPIPGDEINENLEFIRELK
ncbi:PstS family phosphate ABC transporter substrate-binding protein [Pseudogracilibacillus sp. SE30717A]|uniref:PstS family phosphate ABC transporter substrate-binding protein n=1 Tax=Pseudogracilibacillus sp. SE30717A TaxID=3098293 RepID=UPI00300DD0B6